MNGSIMKKKNAFTLIELLVVIAIIAMLLAIIVPAMKVVKEQARRAICSNGMRQNGLAFSSYCVESDDKLPAVSGDILAGWLFDVPFLAGSVIRASNGYEISTLYCPSHKRPATIEEQYTYHMLFDDESKRPNPDGAVGGWAMTDYFWFPTWGISIRTGQYNYMPYTGRDMFVTTMSVKSPGTYPLSSDLVWTQGRGDFYDIISGAEGMTPFPTNHLKSPQDPTGGNTLYCDGHVQWIDFENMNQQYYTEYESTQFYW